MMDDLISRQAALDACHNYEEHVDEIVYTDRFQKPEWLERRDDAEIL